MKYVYLLNFYLFFFHINISFLKCGNPENDYPVVMGAVDTGLPSTSKLQEKSVCFCAWCPCLSQPSWAPTRSDCRFYPFCKPCVSAESRIHYNCGEMAAILFCPCVLQTTVMH